MKNCGSTLLTNATVVSIAQEVGRSAGQVLIRWAIQHGTSVIPKSITPSRIAENLAVFDFQLSDDHMNLLQSSIPQCRIVTGSYWIHPNGPYKTNDDLWS